MFLAAKLKLTGWYVLIIMLISFAFSASLYFFLENEVIRFAFRQRQLIERRIQDHIIQTNPDLPRDFTIMVDEAEIEREAMYRVQVSLLAINGLIFIFSSIASFMLAGKTLEPIQKMMQEQERFVSDASHELKTPLTALRTSLEVALRDKKLPLSEAKVLLTENLEEVKNLQTLSEGLLQLSSYQRLKAQKLFAEVKLQEVVDSAVKKVKAMAKKKSIEILSGEHVFTVKGIQSQLTEVLVILLDNAIKYSPENSQITIDSTASRSSVKLSVIDQGMGIPKKDIDHIFDRFYQSTECRNKGEDCGYGLGLAIAKQIAENHNGWVTVKSTVGKGSVFTLVLPRK